MRLRAKVRRTTRATQHIIHGRESEDIVSKIAWVELESGDGGLYLFYFSAAGDCLADTWHESIEQAKHQAQLEFEIADADWQEVT